MAWLWRPASNNSCLLWTVFSCSTSCTPVLSPQLSPSKQPHTSQRLKGWTATHQRGQTWFWKDVFSVQTTALKFKHISVLTHHGRRVVSWSWNGKVGRWRRCIVLSERRGRSSKRGHCRSTVWVGRREVPSGSTVATSISSVAIGRGWPRWGNKLRHGYSPNKCFFFHNSQGDNATTELIIQTINART